MKRILLIVLVMAGLAVGIGAAFGGENLFSQTTEVSPAPIVENESNLETAAQPQAATPVLLKIPKINVESEVEIVGLDAEKRMDVPKQDMNVAWYKLGPPPGDVGSAVLAGHFDARTGGPAVFYELGRLQKGDEIQVVDEEGVERTFVVVNTAKYKDANFPIETVFSTDDSKARLNLITCAGVFDQQAANYSDRLVVFTELVE